MLYKHFNLYSFIYSSRKWCTFICLKHFCMFEVNLNESLTVYNLQEALFYLQTLHFCVLVSLGGSNVTKKIIYLSVRVDLKNNKTIR